MYLRDILHAPLFGTISTPSLSWSSSPQGKSHHGLGLFASVKSAKSGFAGEGRSVRLGWWPELTREGAVCLLFRQSWNNHQCHGPILQVQLQYRMPQV